MVTILLEADRRPVPEVAKRHGVSAQTIYSWRKHFGTLEPADMKRLRQLEQENGRLKKMVADRELEIDVLKEITRKKWWRTCAPAAGRVCAPTPAVEPPRVRRVLRRAVDTRLPVAAPAARCAGPSGHARARGAVSAVRLPEDPDLSRGRGHPMSAERTYRLWRQAGLQVPRRRPRRRVATRRPRPQLPTARNHVWAYCVASA